MVHILKTFLESGRLVSSMSKLWEDTDVCAKQYMCDFSMKLMTVLLSSYGTIMDRAINASCHVNNIVDGLNALDKHYF